MKEKIIDELKAVINALNIVTVSGRNNLSNLGGSISLLEQIIAEVTGLKEADSMGAESVGK